MPPRGRGPFGPSCRPGRAIFCGSPTPFWASNICGPWSGKGWMCCPSPSCAMEAPTTPRDFPTAGLPAPRAVRGALSIGDSDALSFVPDFVSRDIEGTPPLSMEAFTDILLYLLRTQTPAQLKALHGVGEGLEYALLAGGRGECPLGGAPSHENPSAILSPASTVSSVPCCAASPPNWPCWPGRAPAYLRVLGLRRTAFPLLSEISARSPCRCSPRRQIWAPCPPGPPGFCSSTCARRTPQPWRLLPPRRGAPAGITPKNSILPVILSKNWGQPSSKGHIALLAHRGYLP